MSAAELLQRLAQAFNADAAAGLACTIQFACSSPAHAVIRDGACAMVSGTLANPDVTIAMEDEDLVALLRGELNGMAAYMQGRLQVEGDLQLAQQLPTLFDAERL